MAVLNLWLPDNEAENSERDVVNVADAATPTHFTARARKGSFTRSPEKAPKFLCILEAWGGE